MSTPGVGGQYEINVPAYFALELNRNKSVKDFSIRSNHSEEFYNLDDVIFDITLKDGRCFNFALQLKQSEKDKNIYPGGLEGPKTDVSLEKYCVTFKRLTESNRSKYHYIIYTSRNFDRNRTKEVEKFNMFEDNNCLGKKLFDKSSDKKNTYSFEVNNLTPSSTTIRVDNGVYIDITKADYEEFFSKLTLYTCQPKFQKFEHLILRILKSKKIVNDYLNLFRRWHQRFYTNKTINRETINTHLVDIYLSSFMIMGYRLSDNENEKMYLFEKATKEFDVTVIDEPKDKFLNVLPKIDFDNLQLKSTETLKFESYKSLYGLNSQSTLTECMLRLGKEHKFIERSENGVLDEDLKKKMFAFYFQNLLIFNFNEYSAESVYELMKVYRAEGDKVQFILLGHGVNSLKLSKVQVFYNLENLFKKNYQLYQDMTKVCTISLHGLRSVTLKQLVESLDNKLIFETKEIVEMLRSGYAIVEEKVDLPQHYVQRNVSTIVFDFQTIIKSTEDVNNIIIVKFPNRYKEIEREIQNKGIHLVEISQYNNQDSFGEHRLMLSINGPNSEEMLERIEHEGKSIHVFKMVAKDTFILIKSTSKFICQMSKTKKFSQCEIHSIFNGPLNLLVAQAGMGKSTLIQYLKNKCPWNLWPIYVDIGYHVEFFRQATTMEEVLKHFLSSKPEDPNFLKKLKQLFKEKKKLVFFLDGVDKLPSDSLDKFLQIIYSLSRVGYRVWLTSRQNLEERLSKKFHLFNLRMLKFREKERKAFIKTRLSQIRENEITKFIHRIFNGIGIVNKQFLGMPLHLQMLTQKCLDQTEEFDKITQEFSIPTKLFRYCFKTKLEALLCASEFQTIASGHLEKYEIPALESILHEQSFKKLEIDRRSHVKFLDKIATEKDDLGIIAKVEQRKAKFEDQTYATFFACVWLKKYQDKVTLLKDELFSDDYYRLRLMLNMILGENNPLHLSIIYKNLEQFSNYIDKEINSTDEAGRTALHIACCSGTKKIRAIIFINQPEQEPQWYITMINTIFEKKSDVSERDRLFDFDWLDYACMSGYLYAIEVAVQRSSIQFSTRKEAVYQYYEKCVLTNHCQSLNYRNLLNEINSNCNGNMLN